MFRLNKHQQKKPGLFHSTFSGKTQRLDQEYYRRNGTPFFNDARYLSDIAWETEGLILLSTLQGRSHAGDVLIARLRAMTFDPREAFCLIFEFLI